MGDLEGEEEEISKEPKWISEEDEWKGDIGKDVVGSLESHWEIGAGDNMFKDSKLIGLLGAVTSCESNIGNKLGEVWEELVGIGW